MSISDSEIRDLSKDEIIEKYHQIKLSRDRVFAVTSHDLRSPFSGLLGISEMLSKNVSSFSPEDLQEYISTIHESLQNTYNLIENLFEWGRIERNKLEKTIELIPLKLILEEILNNLGTFFTDKDIELEHDYDEQQIVSANSRMLEFVLKNFLTNAVKYSARGSSVSICCIKNGSNDEIQVIDRGVGISSENQSKLFKPEFSWKRHGTEGEAGTGLGLLASSRFAEYFNAEIRVSSAEAEGSTFSLILPAPLS
ncbi:MAG: HAMP domain-containing histidine kinase [Spirochaetales bacterium]|nr:HAMP domain-containing histidine kinase [Spirochaetales bacterium]